MNRDLILDQHSSSLFFAFSLKIELLRNSAMLPESVALIKSCLSDGSLHSYLLRSVSQLFRDTTVSINNMRGGEEKESERED